MRILIDIGYPAHVHLFRYFTKELMYKGHKVHFTCQEKEYGKSIRHPSLCFLVRKS